MNNYKTREKQEIFLKQGICFQREGDYWKAVSLLNQHLVKNHPTLTKFSYFFDKAQICCQNYPPYAENLNAYAVASQMLKKTTWETSLQFESLKALIHEFGNLKQYKKDKNSPHTETFYYERILLFKDRECLNDAIEQLNQASLTFQILSLETAVISEQVLKLACERKVPLTPEVLVSLTETIQEKALPWRYLLNEDLKKLILKQVRQVFLENKSYYLNSGA